MKAKRVEFYEEFLRASLALANTYARTSFDEVDYKKLRKTSYEELRSFVPKIHLYASYHVMNTYSDFIKVATKADKKEEKLKFGSEEIWKPVSQAHAKLLMALRSDLFQFSPTEIYDRLILRWASWRGKKDET